MVKKKDILLVAAIIAVALLVVLYLAQSRGYVRMATPGMELQLRGGFGHRETVRSGSEPTQVRARRYEPIFLKATRKQDGSTWELQCRGPWGKLQEISVASGQTTTINAGPPLLLKPMVAASRGRVSVGLSILGQAGEEYQNVILKNGRRTLAPQVRIIDQAGNLLSSGRFRYG